jgi:hypothetical protein
MREIRLYGSEGGAAELNRPSLPLSIHYPSTPRLALQRVSQLYFSQRFWPERLVLHALPPRRQNQVL